MTQVTLGGKKKKNSPACMPRFGKRSVFILDPRLDLLVLFKSLENSQCSISGLKKYFPQKEIFIGRYLWKMNSYEELLVH